MPRRVEALVGTRARRTGSLVDRGRPSGSHRRPAPVDANGAIASASSVNDASAPASRSASGIKGRGQGGGGGARGAKRSAPPLREKRTSAAPGGLSGALQTRAPCSIRVQRVEDVSQLIRRVHEGRFVYHAAVRVGANHLGQGGGLAHGSRHRHSLLTAVSRLQFRVSFVEVLSQEQK